MGTQPDTGRQLGGSAEHVELIPGTDTMISHLSYEENDTPNTILIPHPSDNPADPLNWSRPWKLTVVLAQGFYVLFNIMPILATAPLYPVLTAEWNKGLDAVSIVTGITTATYGTANFIVVPCASIFGRRPTLLVSSVISLTSNIWLALSTGYDSFLGARIVAGLGCAANESIMAVVISDMFFLHERGKWMGFYFYCYTGGVLIGPIIAGAFADHLSWRWFFWFCAIMQGIMIVVLVFLTPETRREGRFSSHAESITSVGDSQAIESTPEKDLGQHITKENWTAASPNIGHGRPHRSQFLLIHQVDRKAIKELWWHLVTPVTILFFPITFWATVTANFAANSLLILIMTQSQALAAPPFLWSAQNVGFANFAALIGALVGLAIGGTLSDWVAMRATVRNNGIREPEMRLPALLPFLVAEVIGMIAIAFGFQYGWPWEAPVIVGFTLVGLSSSVIQTISITRMAFFHRL
ncbi:unnamed protein product [Penicillium discolor]